jgi:hypothetical protein
VVDYREWETVGDSRREMFDGRLLLLLLLLLCTLLDLGLVGWRLLPSAGQRRRLPRQRALATIPGRGGGQEQGRRNPQQAQAPLAQQHQPPPNPTRHHQSPALLRYPMPYPHGPPALDACAAALGATFVPTSLHCPTPAHTISSIAHF